MLARSAPPTSSRLASERHEHARLGERGDHRGTAVGEEGQRQTLRRQTAEDHSHVDEPLEDEGERQAEGEEAAEAIGVAQRDPEAARRDHCQKAEDEDGPRQAELLADHREDEVGMRLGEVEHLLSAPPEPDAPEAARAERDEGLLQLEVDAEGIAVRVDEGKHAPQAVTLPEHPVGHERQRGEGGSGDQAHRDTSHEQHEDEKTAGKRSRPEVRFEQHEPSDDGDHQAVRDDAELEAPETLALLGERGSQVEDDRELGELGGLQGERAEMEPAARAAARHADPRQEHEDEARHGDEEKRVGRAAIGLRGEPRRDEGHDGAERDRDEVLAEEQEPVAEAFLAVEVAHVEHHDDTEADQRADREDEPRVSSQRIPDARALTGERATEGGRRRGERPGLRVAGRAITQLAQGNASTAARNARPRAA